MKLSWTVYVASAALLAACAATTEDQIIAPPAAPDAAEPAAPPVAPPVPTTLERVEPPFDGVSTVDAVVDYIKEHEGLRLEAYQGPSGAWLIGYGHGGDDVTEGKTITEAEAETLLRGDLAAVEGALRSQVTVPVHANEFSAMVDLAYNIGTGNFRESSVLRLINQGDRAGAADAFLLWNKTRQNGVLVVSPVLEERRAFEKALFLNDEAPAM